MPEQGPLIGKILSLRDFLRRGARSHTALNTYWLGSSSIVNGLLGAASSALLARALGINDFGTYTLSLTLMNLLADLSDLGIGISLVRFGAESIARGDETRFRRVLGVVIRMKLVLGCVVIGGALLFLRPIIGAVFNHVDARIASYFLIAVGASVVTIAANFFAPVFQSFGDFRAQAVTSFARSLSRLLLIVALVTTLGGCSVALALWIECASVVVLLAWSYAVSPVKRFPLGEVDAGVFREVFSFNRWVLLYQLITLVVNKMDVFMVAGLASAGVLGIYGAAAKISGLVIAVTNSYYAVLIAEMSSVAASPEALRRRQRAASIAVTGFCAGIALLAVLARPVTVLLFGENFAEAAVVLQIMCVGQIFTVITYPLSAVLFARNQTAVLPLMAVGSAFGLAGGNLYLLPKFGAPGAAVAFSLSAMLAWATALLYYFATRRSDGRHIMPGM